VAKKVDYTTNFISDLPFASRKLVAAMSEKSVHVEIRDDYIVALLDPHWENGLVDFRHCLKRVRPVDLRHDANEERRFQIVEERRFALSQLASFANYPVAGDIAHVAKVHAYFDAVIEAARHGSKFLLERTLIGTRMSVAAQVQRHLIKQGKKTELARYREILLGTPTTDGYIRQLVHDTKNDKIRLPEQLLATAVAKGLSDYIDRRGEPRFIPMRPERRSAA